MKKKLHSLWSIALAAMMTATVLTSCSRDDADAQNNANGAPASRVCFTATLPQDFTQPASRTTARSAAATRTSTGMPTPPDAVHKLRCILEVWSNDLSTLIVRKEVVPAEGDTDIRFEFDLENPADYQALLWADFIETVATETPMTTPNNYTHYDDNPYTTHTADGLKAVRIALGNVSGLDAFSAVKPFTKHATALTNLTATLTRALTKVTFAEKNADNFALLKKGRATYTVPLKLNVATGEPFEEISMTQDFHPGGGVSESGTDITIKGIPCKVIFSQYILAGDDDDTMGEIALEFTPTDAAAAAHKQLRPVTIPAGLPLKRNYCVNAAGSLIQPEDAPSNAVAMTVDISSEWGKPDVEKNLDAWNGTLPATENEAKETMATAITTDGSGTARNYVFTITTAKQLAALAYLVNGGVKLTAETGGSASSGRYSSAHYLLATDIDLDNRPWTPIGNNNYYFAGTFDGQGHTVSNMKVDITDDANNAIYAGFFGNVSGSAQSTIIQNLIVEGEVRAHGASSCCAGGVCGELFSTTLQFCRFNGTVESTMTDNSRFNFAGGIAGRAVTYAAVNACISHATVTRSGGEDNNSGAGGLLGFLASEGSVATCLYSAWNSDSTAKGIGMFTQKNGVDIGTIDASNHGFTTVSELNALLPAMNRSVPDRNYEWKAADDADAYPILVPVTPAKRSGNDGQ